MDVLDLVIMASMALLAVCFASYAVLEWRDARTDRRPDAQIIQHPSRDKETSSAA
jgi:hypothetical protein